MCGSCDHVLVVGHALFTKGRLVMGSPMARTFAFIYALMLHLLVFFVSNMPSAIVSC